MIKASTITQLLLIGFILTGCEKSQKETQKKLTEPSPTLDAKISNAKKASMSFFVTSSNNSGNLGGLRGC